MFGIPVVISAPAIVALGVAASVGSRTLFAVSSVGLGLPVVATGITMVVADDLPLAVGVVGAGVGVSILNTGLHGLWQGPEGERLREWWARVTLPAGGQLPNTGTNKADGR